MVITICIGSSCHLKGSREIVTKLDQLITEKNLKNEIELVGSFCMGECMKGVCLKIDEELFSVSPTNIEYFFKTEVLRRLSS